MTLLISIKYTCRKKEQHSTTRETTNKKQLMQNDHEDWAKNLLTCCVKFRLFNEVLFSRFELFFFVAFSKTSIGFIMHTRLLRLDSNRFIDSFMYAQFL